MLPSDPAHAAQNASGSTTAQRLHNRTTTWPLFVRAGWWVLLLPVALALFSAGRLHGWSRRTGLTAAALLAGLFVIGAVAEPPPAGSAPSTFASAAEAKAGTSAANRAAADKAAIEKAAAEQAAADKAAADKAAAEAPEPAARPAAKEYANCTDMCKDFPEGVARQGAVNQGGTTKHKPYYDNALYEANTKSDRDKDGIACEA